MEQPACASGLTQAVLLYNVLATAKQRHHGRNDITDKLKLMKLMVPPGTDFPASCHLLEHILDIPGR